MWKNKVQPDRPYSTCYITKAIHTHTHTHMEYVILPAFLWQQWLCEHASVLPLYGNCLSCICRDTEDPACSTFRRPNSQFSVNKNKDLEFQSSNKANTQAHTQYQLALPHADTVSNVKYADKPHTPSIDGSQLQGTDFKEEKT